VRSEVSSTDPLDRRHNSRLGADACRVKQRRLPRVKPKIGSELGVVEVGAPPSDSRLDAVSLSIVDSPEMEVENDLIVVSELIDDVL
jgi:hypothetical protein